MIALYPFVSYSVLFPFPFNSIIFYSFMFCYVILYSSIFFFFTFRALLFCSIMLGIKLHLEELHVICTVINSLLEVALAVWLSCYREVPCPRSGAASSEGAVARSSLSLQALLQPVIPGIQHNLWSQVFNLTCDPRYST